MGALGLALAWFGYWVAFYGYDQLQGGNNSFVSLGVPGKYQNAPKDSGGAGQAAKDSAASQKLAAANAANAAKAKPSNMGGTGSPLTGTGVTQAGGGVTVLYDASGNPTCMDAGGNVVPCPAGTPSFGG